MCDHSEKVLGFARNNHDTKQLEAWHYASSTQPRNAPSGSLAGRCGDRAGLWHVGRQECSTTRIFWQQTIKELPKRPGAQQAHASDSVQLTDDTFSCSLFLRQCAHSGAGMNQTEQSPNLQFSALRFGLAYFLL